MLGHKSYLPFESLRLGDVVTVHSSNQLVRAMFETLVQRFSQTLILMQFNDFNWLMLPESLNDGIQSIC